MAKSRRVMGFGAAARVGAGAGGDALALAAAVAAVVRSAAADMVEDFGSVGDGGG